MYLRAAFLLFFIHAFFSSNYAANEIRITKVEAGNNQDLSSFIEIPMGAENAPILSYNQNYLIFNFNTDSLVATKSIFYRLEGLDYNWIECVDCKQVQYAHLDGGEYNFLLRTNEEEDSIVEFPFRIEGNIWHQWWFVPLLLLFFLGISGIGFYFFALYKMRQEVRAQLLVHKEKLAAMVDLTAGVAHEIQNPLNFVNNFADLSSELVIDAEQELNNNDLDEVKEILDYLKENLLKISNHGGRASSIIREMQEHAKPISTIKSPTQINAFCQTYLEMAHRAYAESNNTVPIAVKTQFDGSLKEISIAQDEMKKVLLNTLSNAFYACLVRSAESSAESSADQGVSAEVSADRSVSIDYNPLVSITTQRLNTSTTITIKDNGIGMSQETIDKVFQPFFTTKPAGQGTGLGMSISYDIITKGHGGELKVESVEGEGTTFTIQLPL